MGAILCPLQVDNHKEGTFAEGELQRASQLACFCNAQLENLPASVTSMARMLCGKDLNHAKVKYAIFGKHSLLKLQAKMKDFKRRQVGNELKAREPRHRGEGGRCAGAPPGARVGACCTGGVGAQTRSNHDRGGGW